MTELFGTLPWHTWFSSEISRDICPKGDGCPEMERHFATEVCDYDGRHVCWAKSLEHAIFIVNAVNHLHRKCSEDDDSQGRQALAASPGDSTSYVDQ